VSITPIDRPLAGEHVVGLAPENAADASRWWLRRPNLFAGRTLTAPTLSARQDWAARHIALRGQAYTPGVVRGLETALFNNTAGGLAGTRLALMQGQGLSVDGEDVRVLQALEVALADLPVVADGSAFAGLGSAGGEGGDELASTAAKVVGPTLGTVVAALPDALPRVGILLLQPVTADRIGEFDPSDPCALDGCGKGNVISFEDWRIGDAARLLWYAWPEEFVSLPPLPSGAPGRWRNELAWRIFDAERMLAADETLPLGGLRRADRPGRLRQRLDAAVPRSRQRGAERRSRPLRAYGGGRRQPRHPLAAAGVVASALRTARRADCCGR
jgi:hypothetical protein